MNRFNRFVGSLDRWGSRHGLERDPAEVVPAKVLLRRVITPPLLWYTIVAVAVVIVVGVETAFAALPVVMPLEAGLLLWRATVLENRDRRRVANDHPK